LRVGRLSGGLKCCNSRDKCASLPEKLRLAFMFPHDFSQGAPRTTSGANFWDHAKEADPL
jgi:hypothetical protein